jgi:hypothetical protein
MAVKFRNSLSAIIQAVRESSIPIDGNTTFVRVRIPMKPATDSNIKPARHSDFIPAGVPI